MADLIDLEARISALEMIVVAHILQSGVGTAGFDPTSFAASRRDAWAAVGKAVCAGCSSQDEEKQFAEAYARALERIGQLLVVLAEPVQEAVDEVLNSPDPEPEDADASGAAKPTLEEVQRTK
jgi:hypothetical protein